MARGGRRQVHARSTEHGTIRDGVALSEARNSHVLKCKFCPYTTPAWHRESVQLDERDSRREGKRGIAFREGWRGLEAHVACIHPKEYSKIKKGLAQFDQDKKWALKL